MTQRDHEAAAADDPTLWIDQHGDQLYRFALARVQDATVAEDLVQETFLAALNARNSFQGRSTVRTWLVAILKNKIVDHIRKASREKTITPDDGGNDPIDMLFNERGHWKDNPGDWHVNPGKVLEQKEFMQVFAACLKKLPERLAHAFMLREMEGLTPKEICQVMDISSSNSWVILYRARMHLRRCLTEKWSVEVFEGESS